MKNTTLFKSTLFTLTLLALVLGAIRTPTAAVAAPHQQDFEEDCFAVADEQDVLVRFNKLTGATTIIGDTIADSIEAMAFIPGAATLYATNDNRLGTINLTTGAYSALPFAMGTGNGEFGDIEFNDINGMHFDNSTTPATLYVTHRRDGTGNPDVLLQLDPDTGLHVENAFGAGIDYIAVDIPAGTNYHDIDDIAINPITGVMYGIANVGGGVSGLLVIIDKGTGDIIEIGETYPANPVPDDNLVIDDLEGLSFFNDGRLYASTGDRIDPFDTNRLWQIDETSGIATLIGPFGSDLADIEALGCLTAEAFLGIEKHVNGRDANLPESAVDLPVGSPVIWTFLVANTGGATARNVEINDDQLGAITDCDQDAPVDLDPGEVMRCTATGTATEGLHRNIATVTGDSASSGEQLTANDPAHYFGYDAQLTLEKETNDLDSDTAPGASIDHGDPITWTYTVTNTGSVRLENVVITDDQEGEVCTIAALDVDETDTCTASGTAQFGQYENLGTARGDAVDEGGNPILNTANQPVVAVDTDPSHYFGIGNPSISLEKSTNNADADASPGPYIPAGDPITWRYVVTNTGDVDLVNIRVTDNRVELINCPQDTLDVGESMTCTATGSALTGQYDNLGTVAGDPVNDAGDPLELPDGSTADDVTDSDPSHYFGAEVNIEIEKRVAGNTADTAPGPQFPIGTRVEWTYVVSNTGNVALEDVSVTDDQGVVVTCPQDTLDAGESMTCTGVGIVTAGAYVNTGTATGTSPDTGDTVEAEDPANHEGVDPTLAIEKRINGEHVTEAPGPFLAVGSDITWTYIVSNNTDLRITEIDVTDDQGVAVTCPETALDAGESMTCTGSGTATTGQYVNVGTAVGTPVDDNGDAFPDENGDPITTDPVTDDSFYFGADPSVTIEKSTNGADADTTPGPYLEVGAAIRWQYVVTNTGNVTLDDISVTDDQGVTITCPKLTLTPTESMTCTGAGTATVGQYTNEGAVTATPVDDNDDPILDENDDPTNVTDEDDSHYYGANPQIQIEKSTNGEDADDAPGPNLTPGSDVTWTYVVTNTGNVRIEDISVVDNQGIDVTCPETALDAGASMTCTAEGVAIEGQYENIGTVTGAPVNEDGAPILNADGDPLTTEDADSSHYFGANPGISLEKAPGTQTVDPGSDVTFTITVTNTGNVPLTNVTVTDTLTPDCEATFAELAVGASETYTCVATNVRATFTNIAVVEATDPNDETVTDEDDADVNVPGTPGLRIEKSTDTPSVVAGATVEFSITVTNTGDVDLTNVVVTDDTTPDCDRTFDRLDVGDDVTYTCKATNVLAGFTNVALVEATDPTGDPITADDDATVNVTVPAVAADDPSLSITKSTDTPSVTAGTTVEFSITVTNTGNVDLTNVEVKDPNTPDCDRTFDSLAVGEEVTYTCQATNVITGFINVATVTGTPPVGDPVSADDSAEVTVTGEPAIEIEKAPDSQNIDPGGTATFGITVFNRGNVTLTDIAVNDPQVPECNNTIDTLAPGAEFTYNCTVSGVATSFTNVATATGEDPTGTTVTADDSAEVVVNASASIGDFVFHDINGNGVQDDGEVGVPDQVVQLLDDTGTVIGERRTNADGTYQFDGLSAGVYNIEFRTNAQFYFTAQDFGIDDAKDSDAVITPQQFVGEVTGIVVTDNTNNMTIDAGLYLPSSLGNFVWLDINDDGIQDADEPGIPNVTVNLLDAFGNIVITTLTDSNGFYQFTDLAPSNYQIEVLRPNEFDRFSEQDQGSDDAIDSDFNSNGRTVVITIGSGTNIDTIDAGLVRSQVQGKVSVPSPVLDKVADVDRAKTDDVISYQIIVNNPAEFDLTDLVVTDNLPPQLDFVSTDLGVYDAASRSIRYDAGTLVAGGNITMNVQAKVNASSVAGQGIINVATASSNEGNAQADETVTTTPVSIPVTGFQAGGFGQIVFPVLILIVALVGAVAIYTLLCTLTIKPNHNRDQKLSRQLLSGLLSMALLLFGSGVAAWVYFTPVSATQQTTEVAQIPLTGVTEEPDVVASDADDSVQTDRVIVSTPTTHTELAEQQPAPTDAPVTEVEPAVIEEVEPPTDIVEVADDSGAEPMVLAAVNDTLTELLRPGNTDPSIPHLSIPRLRMTENVTAVPLLADEWDLYSLEQEIGWLPTTGSFPGDDLAMVFAAHVNVRSGRAGPFHDLNQLQIGDQIVYAQDGQEYIYQMTKAEVLNPDDVEQLYVEDGNKILLITCQNWDGVANTYSERLVVTAELIAGP